MDNTMCHIGWKIPENSTRKNDENPDPVCSPDLSPYDFWFFGHAKEQLKDQLITNESDLEGKLTHIWEHASRDLLQSVLFEWMERLEWVIEHAGAYYINPHSRNTNLIDRSREKQGAS
jgi:hypothetical protein